MKIALVAPSLDLLGGQGVQARILLSKLEAAGCEVTFIAVNPRFPARIGWLRRFPYARTLINEALYLPSLARLRHADVVQVFSASYWSFLISPLPAMLAGRLFGKRVLLNYHSGEADDHLERWGILIHPWLRLASEIVVPSQYLQAIFARHGYRARVVPNVIDVSRFRFRERASLRPRLLSTRNLEPHYRVDDTLHAFALVKRRIADATLTVVGYGSQESRLRELAAAVVPGGISFLGRVEPARIPECYDAADIFLNSSIVDNQPLSILEAFASGLPVISTTPGAVAEMVRDRETGRTVPSGNPPAMAATVLALLNEPEEARSIAERARREVEAYTWERVRPKWFAAYAGEAT